MRTVRRRLRDQPQVATRGESLDRRHRHLRRRVTASSVRSIGSGRSGHGASFGKDATSSFGRRLTPGQPRDDAVRAASLSTARALQLSRVRAWSDSASGCHDQGPICLARRVTTLSCRSTLTVRADRWISAPWRHPCQQSSVDATASKAMGQACSGRDAGGVWPSPLPTPRRMVQRQFCRYASPAEQRPASHASAALGGASLVA